MNTGGYTITFNNWLTFFKLFIERTCRPLDPPRAVRLPPAQAASVSWFPGAILK